MSAVAAMMSVAGTPLSVPLPTLDLNFDGQVSSFRRASATAAKTNGDELATTIVSCTRSSTATYLGSNGQIQTAATNTPRVEFDASGNPLGLLVEEARTNLVPQSTSTVLRWPSSNWVSSGYTGQIGQWGISHNPTGSGLTFTTAPDGTNTAARFEIPNHGYVVGRCFMGNSTAYTCANGQTQTVSFWVRNRLSNSGNITMEPYIDNAVSRKTFTQSDMPQNQWVRLSYSFTNNTGSTIGTNRAAWDIEFQQNVDHDFELWGLQIEAAENASSYIPTSGTSLARAADSISLATSNFGVDPEHATLAIDFTLAGAAAVTVYPRIYELHAGSNNTRNMLLYSNEAAGSIGAEFVEGGASTTLTAASSVTYPFSMVHAQRRDGTSGSVAVNGVLGSSATITQGSTTPTELDLGQSVQHSSKMNGHIRRLRYWPSALKDSLLKKVSV